MSIEQYFNYIRVSGIYFVSFCDLAIGFCFNCFKTVLFFVFLILFKLRLSLQIINNVRQKVSL